MLTRSQVARRLQKSVASIRRVEGVLLHPVRDGRGVHRFRVDEVEALAERLLRGEVTLWAGMERANDDNDAPDPQAAKLRRLWIAAEAKASRLARQNAALAKIALELCSSPRLRNRVLALIASATTQRNAT